MGRANKAAGRNYAYDTRYESSPAQKRRRALRNAARKRMMRLGKVRKGDHKDVDHKKGVTGKNPNRGSNLRVVSSSRNRGFRRSSKGKNLGLPRKK